MGPRGRVRVRRDTPGRSAQLLVRQVVGAAWCTRRWVRAGWREAFKGVLGPHPASGAHTWLHEETLGVSEAGTRSLGAGGILSPPSSGRTHSIALLLWESQHALLVPAVGAGECQQCSEGGAHSVASSNQGPGPATSSAPDSPCRSNRDGL